MLTHLISATAADDFALDVRLGLLKKGQKTLPSKYLYDSLGTTLFEAICFLPEYGVTRAEERILRRYASEIVSKLPADVMVAEMGSGTGKKTRLILEALCRKQPTSYYPIEISSTALAMCERELRDIHCISIVGFESEYLDGLLEVAALRKEGQHLMVLFLGGTIGNFDGDSNIEFLRGLRRILRRGDSLLVGTDMEKPSDVLVKAYDDPLDVTAAFNRNLLVRINRELDGDFDLPRYKHRAIFNEQTRSIEMHLLSTAEQTVTVARAGISIEMHEGETIWTETCHKYSHAELQTIAEKSGFRREAQWIDHGWPFAENLWIAE
jgi:dimethylhistidine N-methyltransferase